MPLDFLFLLGPEFTYHSVLIYKCLRWLLWGRKQTEDMLLQQGKEDEKELYPFPWINAPTPITPWMGHDVIKAHLRCLFTFLLFCVIQGLRQAGQRVYFSHEARNFRLSKCVLLAKMIFGGQ